MRMKLQTKIIEDFPKLFSLLKEKHSLMYPIVFGIECGDGWYSLIYALCRNIDRLVKEGDPYPKVVQVKEKFGGLRFYIDTGSDAIFNIIDFAEDLSYSICEKCGSTRNVTQTKGWIITLCKHCLHKYNKKGRL